MGEFDTLFSSKFSFLINFQGLQMVRAGCLLLSWLKTRYLKDEQNKQTI